MCELSVFAQWIYFFPSITEGGNIEAEAESSSSTDGRGGALIYLYFVVFNSLACILNCIWMHLHSTWILTWGYKIKKSPIIFFFSLIIKWPELFNKPPFNINSRLPAIVLKLWSIQPLIGNYVWLAGITAANEEEVVGDEGGESGQPLFVFLSFIQQIFTPLAFFKNNLFIEIHAWWIKWLKWFGGLSSKRRFN